MKITLILILTLLITSCSWSHRDRALLATYGTLSAVDAVQTLSCKECKEMNPVLSDGEGKPDPVKVIGVKAVSFLGVWWIADYFKGYRTEVLIVPVAAQGGAVIWNMQFQ